MNRTIVCLKHGDKYSVEYVNILYNMVKRHSTVDFDFVCITENPIGLSQGIIHVPLPSYRLHGWWFKPWIFSREFPITGTILFMDLDIVINDNIDALWDYHPEQFCIIKDFSLLNPRINSSVFRFEAGRYTHVWENLINDYTQLSNYHGDQDWIYDQVPDYVLWEPSWIVSYKWQVRSRDDLERTDGGQRFKTINDTLTSDAKILVFHGDPKPHLVQDSIILTKWL